MGGRTISRVVALLLGGLFLLLLVASSAVIFGGFIQVENHQTQKAVARAKTAYENELAELNTKATDWGDWDDAWKFTCGTEPTFPSVDLLDNAYTDLQINTILFVNNGDPDAPKQGCPESGGVRILDPAKEVSTDTGTDKPIPEDLRQAFAAGSPALDHHSESSSDHLSFYQTGLISLKEGQLLFVARPVVHSDASGPLAGTVIFGRYIDSSELQKLAMLTHQVDSAGKPTIAFIPLAQGTPPADVAAAAKKLEAGKSTVVTALSSNVIAGYALLKDYRNKPAIVLRIEQPRSIYSQALKSILFFDVALLAIGLIFGSITLLLLQRSVLRPIKRLSDSVATAANTKNYSARIPVRGKDELAKFAESVDKIFDELEATVQLRHELQQLQQLEASQTRPEPIISGEEPLADAERPTQPAPPPTPPSVDNWSDGGKA